MTFLSKATAAFAALSMVAAPVAASAAAPQFDDLRANTEMTEAAAFGEGGEALSGEEILLFLAALAAFIAALVIAADGTDDNATSPN